MYALFKDLALRLMRAPTEPPDPPAGRHDSVQVYRASPGYLRYRLLGFWITMSAAWLALWILFLIAAFKGRAPLILIALLAMVVLIVVQLCAYFAVRIDYDMRYYIVTDRSLRIREGAFIVKEKTVSFANVQNIRVVQGPLLRLFGIWHLKVDTAGGGASEQGRPGEQPHRAQMAGIENAHQVRDLIRENLRRHGRSAGLGDPDDPDEAASRAPVGPEVLEALTDLRRATAALRAAAEARRP